MAAAKSKIRLRRSRVKNQATTYSEEDRGQEPRLRRKVSFDNDYLVGVFGKGDDGHGPRSLEITVEAG